MNIEIIRQTSFEGKTRGIGDVIEGVSVKSGKFLIKKGEAKEVKPEPKSKTKNEVTK